MAGPRSKSLSRSAEKLLPAALPAALTLSSLTSLVVASKKNTSSPSPEESSPLVSGVATRFDDSLYHATKRPSALIDGTRLVRFEPLVAAVGAWDTRTVVLVLRLRRYTSGASAPPVLFSVNPLTRFVALLRNATLRPSPLITGSVTW